MAMACCHRMTLSAARTTKSAGGGRRRGEVKDRADWPRYVDARDRRAVAGQYDGGRTTDAAGGARDHRHPSGQVSRHSLGNSV
jgi:hypothetical protein